MVDRNVYFGITCCSCGNGRCIAYPPLSLDGSIDHTAIASKPTADDEMKMTCPQIGQLRGWEGWRLEGDALCHMNAFYDLLKDWFVQKNYTSVLLTREGYNKRLEFGLYLNNGGDSRESQLNGNSNAYKWAAK